MILVGVSANLSNTPRDENTRPLSPLAAIRELN